METTILLDYTGVFILGYNIGVLWGLCEDDGKEKGKCYNWL